ncbi:MAG: hypothetical protein J6W82_01620 [Bacteroidales bacterium]|nr:hypothetical protein [Bacteroidales bacterium]
MNLVDIFWTAGVDSTCRVLELAACQGFVIRPWYIVDPGRRSAGIEMERIRKMTELIRSNPETVSELQDVNVVPLAEVSIDPEIQAAYDRIGGKYALGKQYVWLASFLAGRDLYAELACELPHTHIGAAIVGECAAVSRGEGPARVLAADPSAATADGLKLMGRMLFPGSIWEMTKQDEMDHMCKLGYREVFELTWFCHRPVLGMPCGHCAPCRSAAEEGFGWRIPKASRIIYPIARPVQKLFKKR